jgi:hypothetical protein
MFLNDSFITTPEEFDRDRVFLNYIYLCHCADPSRQKVVQVNNGYNIHIVKRMTESHPSTIVYSPLLFKIKILVGNIFSDGSAKIWQDLMLSDYMLYPLDVNIECDAEWYKEHNRSMKQEIHFVKFHPFFHGKSFKEAARLIYTAVSPKGFCGGLLVGCISIEKTTAKKTFYINPYKLEINKQYKAIVIAENLEIAKMVENFTDQYFDHKICEEYSILKNPSHEKAVSDDQGNMFGVSNPTSDKNLRKNPDPGMYKNDLLMQQPDQDDLDNSPQKLIPKSTTQDQTVMPLVLDQDSPMRASEQGKLKPNLKIDRVPGLAPNDDFSALAENFWGTTMDMDQIKQGLQDQISKFYRGINVRKKPKLSNNYYVLWNNDLRGLIEGHIIVIAPKPILFDIIKEIRVHSNRSVCFLNNEKPSTEWQRVLLHFTNVYYLQGDPLSNKELKYSSMDTAFYVIIFANPKYDLVTFLDHESFILINTLKDHFNVPFSFELTNSEMMKFVRSKSQKAFGNLNYIYWQDYVNGNTLISQVVEDLPAAQPKAYNNLEFLCELFNDGEGSGLQDNLKEILITIDIPEGMHKPRVKDIFEVCMKLRDPYLVIGVITSKYSRPSQKKSKEDMDDSQNGYDNDSPKGGKSPAGKSPAFISKAKRSKAMESPGMPLTLKKVTELAQSDAESIQGSSHLPLGSPTEGSLWKPSLGSPTEGSLLRPLGGPKPDLVVDVGPMPRTYEPVESIAEGLSPFDPRRLKADTMFMNDSFIQGLPPIEEEKAKDTDFIDGMMVILKPLASFVLEEGDRLILMKPQHTDIYQGLENEEAIAIQTGTMADKKNSTLLSNVMKIAISVNKDGQDSACTQKLKATTLERIDKLITSNWDDKNAKKSKEIEKYKIDLDEAERCMEGGLEDVNKAITTLLKSKVRRFAKRDKNSEALLNS